MINREYDDLKFSRTYLGGSKKKETEIFTEVQKSIDFKWIEYRRILFPYFEDVIHVMFSRAYVTNIASIILLALTLILALFNFSMLSLITLSLSIISRFLHFLYERKTKQALNSYNLSQSVVKIQIKNQTGLDI